MPNIEYVRNFDAFAKQWKYDTFMQGAFGGPMDFDEYLDDPETGVGEETYDLYTGEITEYLL